MTLPANTRLPAVFGGLALTASLLLAPLSATAQQQQVYQWKDAQGRTHYSSTPPSNGRYGVRQVSNRASTPVQAAETAPAAKPESEQCRQARANLAVLGGGGSVQMTAADGSQRTLSDEERAAQARIAETVIANACNKP